MKHVSKFLIIIIALALIGCIAACDISGCKDEVTTLNAPTNVRIENGYVCWNPIENTVKYLVSIDGKEDYSDDYRMVLPTLSDGIHIFKVKAVGDGLLFLTSAFSDECEAYFDNNEVVATTEGYYSQFDELTKQESFLGYGFDIINSSVFCDKYVNTSYPIFNTNELMKQRLLKVDSKRVYINETKSSNIDDFMASWNANANVGVSWNTKLVSGSVDVEAKYSGGSETAKSKYYHAISMYNQKFYIVMQSDIDTYKNILSDGFTKDLYSQMSPAKLFDKYGTHFITSAVMGGRINSYYLYTSETEKKFNDISSQVSSNVTSLFKSNTTIDVSMDYKNTAKEQGIDNVNTMEVIGGGDFAMLSDNDIRPNYADWEKSLDDHVALMGIKDSSSLTAIWNLVDVTKETNEYTWDYEDGSGPVKVTRAQQLEAYFYKYGMESYNDLCKNAGIREIITPTSITDIRVNNETSTQNTFEVYSGTTCNISFNYLPENAIGNKSITLITDSPYINIKENLQLEILHGMPEDSYITLQLVAGSVTKIIKLHVTGLYDIQLRLNGGKISDDIINNLKGLPGGTWIETPAEPTREGYTFVGWFTDSDLINQYVETSIKSDFSLYAKWVDYNPLATFNVTLLANGGNGNSGFVATVNRKLPTFTAIIRTYYKLNGYYTTENGGTKIITADGKLISNIDGYSDANGNWVKSSATELYAQWQLISYSINYNLAGGTYGSFHPESVETETEFTVSAPTRIGYTFIGWDIIGMDNCNHTYNNKTTTTATLSQTVATTFKNLRQTEGTVQFIAQWVINLNPIVSTMTKYNCADNNNYNIGQQASEEDDRTRHNNWDMGELLLLGCDMQSGKYIAGEKSNISIKYHVVQDVSNLPKVNTELTEISDDSATKVNGTDIQNETIGYGAYWVRITYKDKSQNQYHKTNVLKNANSGTYIDLVSSSNLTSNAIEKIEIVLVYELHCGAPGDWFGIWWDERSNWRCEYTYAFN